MTQVNLYEAKTGLSALVDRAAAGEDIVIAKNGKPRAVIVSLERAPPAPPRKVPRLGRWESEGYRLPENFNDPDPEIEAMFYGEPDPPE